MPPTWLSTTTPAEAEAFAGEFWRRHRTAVADGRFWADRIKDVVGQPAERLRIALENLPLPAAFGEAAIAVRALIKLKKGAGQSYSPELALLYKLAALASFSMPYSVRLQEPGFNVLESIPASVVLGLPYSYKSLGYLNLGLINKNDGRLLEREWGPAEAHTTLLQLHRSVWEAYEQRLSERRKTEQVPWLGLLNGDG